MSDQTQNCPHIYKAINNVAAALATSGISKEQRNQQQGYAFRGIDDVYYALAPLLAEHSLNIVPRVIERTVTERSTSKGGALFSVTVKVEYDLISSKDGSKHTAVVYGEAMDSGDKATNKAMSAAYKYLALQCFCIPTEAREDADLTTPPEVVSLREQGRRLLEGAAKQGQAALAAAWGTMSPAMREACFDIKNELKRTVKEK